MDLGLAISMASFIALLKVIAIDLILSGDNAIVIAMATRKLPAHKRNVAIFWGTGGAIALRIIFASIIVMLLNIPLVHFFGGLLLLYIAYKVLDSHEEHGKGPAAKDSTVQAIGTIIAADAVMSLDNVVAVAGASGGSVLILAFGVLISIPIMIFGSKLIVSFMEKYPWIAYVGSGILAWTAGDMIFGDKRIMEWFNYETGLITYILTAVVTALVLWLGYMKNKRTETATSY